jgi:hypothetical protein
MDVKEIIKSWLKQNKYDGLCNGMIECGCGVDDLAPCDNGPCGDCEPAMKGDCKTCLGKETPEGCEFDECYKPPAEASNIVEQGQSAPLYKCADCGAPMNEGEAKCFTVCDKCWDKHYKRHD